MSYENRENGGRTEQEIQNDLKNSLGHDSKVGELYHASLKIVNKYLDEIKKDETISDRLDNSNENELLTYKTKLEKSIRDFELNHPGALAKKLENKKDMINVLAKTIDDKENATLRNLKLRGGFVYMKGVREKFKGDIPITLYDSGKIQIDELENQRSLQDLSSIFSFTGTVQEFYTGHHYRDEMFDTRTEEEKDDIEKVFTKLDKKEKKFTCRVPENSEAFNVIKGLVEGKIQNLIDEVVVVGKRKGKPSEGQHEITDSGNTNDTEDKINNKPFDGNFTLKYNGNNNGKETFEIGYDGLSYILTDASKIPLSKGMTIQETGILEAYAQRKVDKRNRSEISVRRQDNLVNPEEDPDLMEYTKNIPDDLKKKIKEKSHELANGNSQKEHQFYNEFVYKSEKRIRDIIVFAKKANWEPMQPPITKRNIYEPGMMEAHFWDSENKTQEFVFWEKGTKDIPYPMYSLIDSNEGDYATYLNASFKNMRENAEYLTQYENQETTPRGIEDQLDNETISNMKEGLKLFSIYIDGCRVDEGHSWDDDDQRLKDISRILKQEIYNLENLKPNQLSKQAIESRTIVEISKLYTHLGMNTQSDDDPWVKEMVTKILYEKSNIAKVRAIYDLNKSHGILGGDPSLVEGLIRQEAFASEGLNMVDYNNGVSGEYFKKMNKIFDMKDQDYEYDEAGNLIENEYTKTINEIYQKIKGKDRIKGGEIIKKILIDKGVISKKRPLTKECEDIAETLNKVHENFLTVDSVKNDFIKRRNDINAKGESDRSDEEKKELNMINNLLNDEKTEEYLKSIADKTNDQIKYGSVKGIMRNNLIDVYARQSYAICIGDPKYFHSSGQSSSERQISDMVNENIRGKYSFKLKEKDIYEIKKFCLEQSVAILLSIGVGELVSAAVTGIIKSVKAMKFVQNLTESFNSIKMGYTAGRKTRLVVKSLDLSAKDYAEKGISSSIIDKIQTGDWTNEPYSINNLIACLLGPVLKRGVNALSKKEYIRFFGEKRSLLYNNLYRNKAVAVKIPIVNQNLQLIPVAWTVSQNITKNALGATIGGLAFPKGTTTKSIDENTAFRCPTDEERTEALIGYTKYALENRQNENPQWNVIESKVTNGELEIFPGENGDEIFLGNVEQGKVEPLSNRESFLT